MGPRSIWCGVVLIVNGATAITVEIVRIVWYDIIGHCLT